MRPRYWHFWISALLGMALIPLLLKLRLPLRFDWKLFASAYWGLSFRSIFAAAVLCLVAVPRRTILQPLIERYRRAPFRIALLLLYFMVLGITFNWRIALLLTVDSAAIIELWERKRREPGVGGAAVLLPALYLFGGLLLVFAYNAIVATVHFPFAYDRVFNAMDRWIFHGASVSDLSHWAVRTFPLSFFRFLESIYFGMFPQIGVAILFVSISEGRRRGLQFVGTILMAYYFALGIFYLWPSQGPYFLCPGHFSQFPAALQVYSIQKTAIARALSFWNRAPMQRISIDYLIAFPCMHIAQPLIVMWFLRRWRRIVIVLCVYDCVLIGAILLLEWHYFVDIIGGILVAGIAIAITDDEIWNVTARPRFLAPRF